MDDPAGSARLRVERAMANLLGAAGVDPSRRQTRVAGVRIHSLELGDGLPVVLIHGGSGGGANWFRQMGPLARRYRVLAPDLPGFGLSSAAPPGHDLGVQAADLLLDWAREVIAGPFDVVGTSFGGLAAFRMAQRAATMIRRVVLLDSIGLGRQIPVVVRAAALPGLGRLLLRPTRTGTRWLLRTLLVADENALEPGDRARLIDYLLESARMSEKTLIAAVSRFAGLSGQREILSDDELRASSHPTLILWGARDAFLPVAHAQRAAALMPRAQLAVLRDAGHSPNWETPAAVTDQILGFLEAR